MSSVLNFSLISLVVTLAVMARILLRPNRVPASRVAWLVVVSALPVFGIVAYLLLGEVNIGRRRAARVRAGALRLGVRALLLGGTAGGINIPGSVASRSAPRS